MDLSDDRQPDRTLDCKGLKCPMPIVHVAKSVREMSSGQLLRVEASDLAFPADIRAWAEMTGNELVTLTEGHSLLATIRVR